MEELKNYLKELISIRRELNLINWTDDSLADIGSRIFISQTIQENKEKNIDKMKEKQIEKATDRQIFALKKLNYRGDLNLNKMEASQLIAKLKSK